jgi:hypothetical protein
MQAVVDEVILGNVDPQKVLLFALILKFFCRMFFWCVMSVVLIAISFQPPKTWNLTKLLDEFVSLGGNLLTGNKPKCIVRSCSSAVNSSDIEMLCRNIQGDPRGRLTIIT